MSPAQRPAASGAPAACRRSTPRPRLRQSLLGQPQSAWPAGGEHQAARSRRRCCIARDPGHVRPPAAARLDDLERAGHLWPGGTGRCTAARSQTRDADRLGVPAGAPEAAAIDALAMIFEAIFACSTLPEPIKTALSSLQIPTLRAVMLDRDFFTADAHPARQLLDKMARAAVGLPFDVTVPPSAVRQYPADRLARPRRIRQ